MWGKSAGSYFDLIFYFFDGDSAIVDTFLSQNFAICDRMTIEYRKIRDRG